MIKAWLRYLILLVLASALYIFYVGYISYFLFLLILSLPILSVFLFFIAAYRFELKLYSPLNKIVKGTTQDICIRSRTNNWIPLAKVEADLQIHNYFHQTTTNETFSFTSEGDFSDVIFAHEFSTCGHYRITITFVYVYDILHLLKRKKHMDAVLDLYVFPIPSQIQEELTFPSQLEDDEFDMKLRGNNSGDTFDVHEYREGDSLHNIHWKLTAKLDKMMIREFSMPIAKHPKIYFDLYGTYQDADAILGQVYGCSLHLLSNHYEHDLFQYEAGSCIKEVHITSHKDLEDFICGILSNTFTLSATSSLKDIALLQDSILIQKNKVITYLDRGGEQHASTK